LAKCTCQEARGGGVRDHAGVKICTYQCTCNDGCGKIKTFTISYSAGSSDTAICIGQIDPHYTQPGRRVPIFEERSFDTESLLDRINPVKPPNEFMDKVEQEFNQ